MRGRTMQKVRILASMMFLGALVTAGLPNAKADSGDWLTYMTFSAPVEIPGMVLSPGKYEFKLLDPLQPNFIVAIYNSSGQIMEAVQAIPDYRMDVTGKTVVTLEEREANRPEAIKSWFYPGENYGVDFLYPKAELPVK